MQDPFFTQNLAQANQYLEQLKQINIECMRTICQTHLQKIKSDNYSLHRLQEFHSWEEFFTAVVFLKKQLIKYSALIANHTILAQQLH